MDTSKGTGKIAFKIVKGSKDNNYKNGHAKLAWDNLKRRYAPNTAPSLLKLKKEFNNKKLKIDEDPDIWIDELEEIKEQINDMNLSVNIDEAELIIHIVNNLPDEYHVERKDD